MAQIILILVQPVNLSTKGGAACTQNCYQGNLNFLSEGLNGNLNISQDLKYRNPNSSAVYSTHKPVRLHLNLTDKFKEKPTMDYTWFVDGEILLVTNTPEKDLPIRDTGEHEIKVDARATETVPDCGDFRDEDVKGQFIETVILKGRSLEQLVSFKRDVFWSAPMYPQWPYLKMHKFVIHEHNILLA